MSNEMVTKSLPIIFCPRCQRYLGVGLGCTCGWQRLQPIPQPGEAFWQVGLGTTLRRGPVRGGGFLFVGGEDGLVRVVSTVDVAQRPPQDLKSPIQARPACDGKRVVVGTRAGEVFAFAVQDGIMLWPKPYATGAPGTGAPVIVGGLVYVGDALGRLHALDLRDGRSIWPQPFAARKRIGAAPAATRDWIVAGAYDEYLYAVDARQGSMIWEQHLGDRITRAPAISGKWAFAGTEAGRICKLDLLSGAVDPKFAFTAGGAVRSDLLLSADGSVLHAGSADGHLYAIDTKTGAERHRFEVGSPVAATLVAADGLLFGGSNDGRIFALEADSLELAWGYPADSAVVGLAAGEGMVFAATQSGTLCALPWHLGQWAWAADWLERRGRKDESATFHALAGDYACFLDERCRRYEAALAVWQASVDPERAARLREAALDPPDEVAREYEHAAQIVHPRDKQRGADLYLRAAAWYDEAARETDARRCRGQASKLRLLPRLEVREFNFPTFEFGENGQLDFDVHNFGDVPAADLWVRMGGQLAKPVQFGLDRAVPPRDRVGVGAEDVVPLGKRLRIELQEGKDGPPLGCWVFDLDVKEVDATVVAKGDVGALILRLSHDAPLPKIHIRGDLGMLKVQVDEPQLGPPAVGALPFEWPPPTPGLVTDERELIIRKALDEALQVELGHAGIVLADGRSIAQREPGRYTRSEFPELRKPLVGRAPTWEVLDVDLRPSLLVIRVGPFPTSDFMRVGVELGLVVKVMPERALDLWLGPGPRAGSISASQLAEQLQPGVSNVVQVWLQERRLSDLKPGAGEREGLTTALEAELSNQLAQAGLKVMDMSAINFICPG